MKRIKQYAIENNLTLRLITYTFSGIRIRRKGLELTKGRYVLFSVEPIERVGAVKWMVTISPKDYNGPRYFKRITTKILRNLDGLDEKTTGFVTKD